jgi:hypothetical protein
MKDQEDESSDFMKLFWKEQQKMFARNKQDNVRQLIFLSLKYCSLSGHRWHPMLVRYALLLHAQSPAAYKLVQESGVLRLPGESTLWAFTHAIHPEVGFNPEVIEVRNQANKLDENQ